MNSQDYYSLFQKKATKENTFATLYQLRKTDD